MVISRILLYDLFPMLVDIYIKSKRLSNNLLFIGQISSCRNLFLLTCDRSQSVTKYHQYHGNGMSSQKGTSKWKMVLGTFWHGWWLHSNSNRTIRVFCWAQPVGKHSWPDSSVTVAVPMQPICLGGRNCLQIRCCWLGWCINTTASRHRMASCRVRFAVRCNCNKCLGMLMLYWHFVYSTKPVTKLKIDNNRVFCFLCLKLKLEQDSIEIDLV